MTDFELQPPSPQFVQNDAFATSPEGKSRGLTALLAIFVGYLGIHYFYLGKPVAGIITLVLSFVSCGFFDLLIFIQGISMLCIDNNTFRNKYVTTRSSFPLF